MQVIGEENLFLAEARLGAAMQKAYTTALDWLGDEALQHPHWLDAQAVSAPESKVAVGDEVIEPIKTLLPAAAKTAVEPDRLLYLVELERLAVLKDKGVVTEEEFSGKKQQILGL